MNTYKIIHKEELVGWYYIDAESEEAALEEFDYQAREGKIDFSDMEMTDSHDEAIFEKAIPEEPVRTYTVCYAATGGIEIRAKSEEEARERFWQYHEREALDSLGENGMEITEVFEVVG